MWEVYESVPGYDHRLQRVIINKEEGNDRNIECVGYKENESLLCGFSLLNFAMWNGLDCVGSRRGFINVLF